MIKYITVKKNRFESFLLVCVIGTIVLPLLIGISYAVPAADDFSNANGIRGALQNSNMFVAACIKTKETYLTWQGTFLSTFLVNILKPLETTDMSKLHLLLYLNVLLIAGATLWMGIVIAKKMYNIYNRNNVLMLLIIFIFLVFGACRGGREAFYWFTGACVYTFPMSLTLSCLAFYAQYLWGKKTMKGMISLCVMSFLASGGVLQVTAVLCYGMLILWGLYLVKRKDRDSVVAGFPFITALIGALINAFAPGNFTRHTYLEEGIHVFKAFRNVIKVVITQMREMLTENLFLYIVLFCIIFGIYAVSKPIMEIRKYHPVLLFIVLLAGLMISLFPLCLGKGTGNMSLRNVYICDLYVGLGSAVWALELGGWLGTEKGYKISKEGIWLVFICAGLVFFRGGDIWKFFHGGATGRTFYELCSGDLQKNSLEWGTLLRKIENSEESKIVLRMNKLPDTILMTPGLSEDESYWVNFSVAQFYGKDTIAVVFEEE